jgi:endo-1,4-beta-xylanase
VVALPKEGNELTRRHAIAAVAAACSTAGIAQRRPPTRLTRSTPCAPKRRRFGSAVAGSERRGRGQLQQSAYAAPRSDCELLVPENQLKWQWIRRSPGEFDFRAFDAIAGYAAAHGFKLRGHTLFWTPTKWYPKWLAEMHFGSAAEAERCWQRPDRAGCWRSHLFLRCRERSGATETGQIATRAARALGGEAFSI